MTIQAVCILVSTAGITGMVCVINSGTYVTIIGGLAVGVVDMFTAGG